MKVTKDLKVSKEEFYNYLIDSLYHELIKKVSRKIKRSDIKEGYKFILKYDGKRNSYEIKNQIISLTPFTNYKLQRDSGFLKQTMFYEINYEKDDFINVTYSEENIPYNFNMRLGLFLKKFKMKKMMNNILDQVELNIINNR